MYMRMRRRPCTTTYIDPVNQLVLNMKNLCDDYKIICYRDVREFAIGFEYFQPVRDHFQIGYLPTLQYISFPRHECIPTIAWVEGFIKAAHLKLPEYRSYTFME